MKHPSPIRVAHRYASGYGSGHMPDREGPPAWNLTDEDGDWSMPGDVFDHPERYTGFRSYLREFWPSILKAQGNPGASIRIYRAVPATWADFNSGDWVTPSLRYARGHLESSGSDGLWHIITAQVPAKALRFAGDDLMEWGYWGSRVKGDVV